MKKSKKNRRKAFLPLGIVLGMLGYCAVIIFLYLRYFSEDISFFAFLIALIIPVAICVGLSCMVTGDEFDEESINNYYIIKKLKRKR